MKLAPAQGKSSKSAPWHRQSLFRGIGDAFRRMISRKKDVAVILALGPGDDFFEGLLSGGKSAAASREGAGFRLTVHGEQVPEAPSSEEKTG